MANVHRLGDYNGNNNNNNQNNRYGGQGSGFADQRANNAFENQPLLGGMGMGGGNPRNESFWDMLKFTCCPTFSVKSFMFFIIIVQFAVYIAMIVYQSSINCGFYQGAFLMPCLKAQYEFGGIYPYGIKENFEIWRLITALFLNQGLLQFIMSLAIQMIIGFMMESLLGPLKVAGIYFVSGIGGNLFYAATASQTYQTGTLLLGPQTAIIGLFVSMLGFVLVNWKAFDQQPEIRCCIIAMYIFLIILLLLFNIQTPSVLLSFVGAFLAGLTFSMAVMPHLRGPAAHQRGALEKKMQMGGGFLCLVFFALTLSLFFTVSKVYESVHVQVRGDCWAGVNPFL